MASYVGMEIPKQEQIYQLRIQQILIMRAAEIFYKQLKEESGKETISYLKAKRVSGETARFFNLGLR